MDAATSRFIRIGSTSIGLVGLDRAIISAAAENMEERQAVDFIFGQINDKNYIPPGTAGKYRQALLAEYRKHCNPEQSDGDALIIRIYGSGCVSCNGLQTLLIEVLDRLEIAADIEQIHDPDEIGRAGILMTPALMINGRLKSSGLLPTPAQVEQWIRDLQD
jgi:hypothetical protein